MQAEFVIDFGGGECRQPGGINSLCLQNTGAC
jgi:hypothetical protein